MRKASALVIASALWWVMGPFCTTLQRAEAATVQYQVVTNEIAAQQQDGTKVEVYRFDPAVYVAQQGDQVVMTFRGVKGHDHPIVLEGYDLRGVIHRNQVTTIKFKADKPGFFKLICTAHADAGHNGPMEAYLVVTPRR
jgi:plastocyanin